MPRWALRRSRQLLRDRCGVIQRISGVQFLIAIAPAALSRRPTQQGVAEHTGGDPVHRRHPEVMVRTGMPRPPGLYRPNPASPDFFNHCVIPRPCQLNGWRQCPARLLDGVQVKMVGPSQRTLCIMVSPWAVRCRCPAIELLTYTCRSRRCRLRDPRRAGAGGEGPLTVRSGLLRPIPGPAPDQQQCRGEGSEGANHGSRPCGWVGGTGIFTSRVAEPLIGTSVRSPCPAVGAMKVSASSLP